MEREVRIREVKKDSKQGVKKEGTLRKSVSTAMLRKVGSRLRLSN
jgi:hypothetical protein